ncbi:DNA-binding transcriptional regulator YbjK [Rhodococcoides kyotonense]|uniref:DNA-binding transcriptional regulator YbjK n=1 Tax=Rhodococcoides kyotonense TaxID=398843 RepID=A0A239N4D7_9NOCA|nr:DNA-binding transcriptional regulator YbjK [Rhodococcus kyotonensis]
MISDAATALIAHSGLRALTHRKVDAVLELPQGSTSYYFRTKADLVGAVAERVAECSRSMFDALAFHGDVVDVTVRYMEQLIDERSDQLRARHALMIDPEVDAAVRARLAGSVFSVDRALELFGDRETAEGYVALCEGLVTLSLMGRQVSFRTPIATYLNGSRAR